MTPRVALLLSAVLCACGPSGEDDTDARPGTIDAAGDPDAPTGTPDAATDTPDAADPVDADVSPDAQPGGSDLVINEAVKTHEGQNLNEYIEIKGSANTDYSAYTLVAVDGDDGFTGVMDRAYQVGTTDADGYWWTGYLQQELENGSLSVLLVKDYTGVLDDDIDSDDDGDIDATPPWSELVDAVGFNNTPALDIIYGGIDLGDIGGASRIPDGTDTDQVSDWTENAFDMSNETSGDAKNTPGAANELVP